MPSPSRRRATRLLILLASLAGAGCGAQSSASPTATPEGSSTNTAVQVQVASSDLAVGANRFTFGILDNNHPVQAADHPHITFYYLTGNRAQPVETTTASFNYFARGLAKTAANSAAVQLGGVYVAYPSFPRSGAWGLEVRFRYKGKMLSLGAGFDVKKHSTSPAIGAPVPRSHNPTVAQEPATRLDSGRPPDDMHKLSIAGAIARRKPLVVLFATAAFCTSRLCGPEIEVVKRLENQYRRRVNFVHVEVYKDAEYAKGPAPTFTQWHLQTEPWVFVVNRAGILTAKFEGPTPASEIIPAIDRTLR